MAAPRLRHLGWTLFTVLAALVGLEVGFKVWDFAVDFPSMDRHRGAGTEFTWIQTLCFRRSGCLRHPDLIWTYRPHLRGGPFQLNSRGLRGPELPAAKAADELRIAVVGGSHPFGLGVGEHEAYGAVLERLLKERWPDAPVRFRVVNAAVPGYSSFQVRRLIERDRYRLDADLWLVDVGFNDTTPLTVLWPRPDAELEIPAWKARLANVVFLSSLYWRVRLLVEWARFRPQPADRMNMRTRCSPAETGANLEAAFGAARARGERAVFVTQFYVEFPGRAPPDLPTGVLPRLAGIRLEPRVDVFGALKGREADIERLVQPDGVHATAAGHRLIAETIADFLLAHRDWLVRPATAGGRR